MRNPSLREKNLNPVLSRRIRPSGFFAIFENRQQESMNPDIDTGQQGKIASEDRRHRRRLWPGWMMAGKYLDF